jgi:hypothetical protein
MRELGLASELVSRRAAAGRIALLDRLSSRRAQAGLGGQRPEETFEKNVRAGGRRPVGRGAPASVAGASNARWEVIETERGSGFFVELLIGDEEFEVAACLAHVHLDFLAVYKEFAEIAEKEPPAPCSLVKISLAREGKRSIAADTVEMLLIGDASV